MTNRYHKLLWVVLVLGGLFVFSACSTEKTGWAHRTYHSILTRFNGYFNASEIMAEAEMKIDDALPDDYMIQLPIFKELPENQIDLITAEMDKVIEKCAKVIRKNSIKKRGKEYTKWIDDSYFLMGKAFYYKRDDAKAFTALNYAAKKFKDQNARFEARLWLARLYSRQDNNDKALKILSMLDSDKETPERLKLDISKMYVDIFLKEGNVDGAMQELQRALILAKKKEDKLRLTYLQGQLYKEQDERQESMKSFARVLRLHPEYKMEFYTRIQMAMAYSVGAGDAESVRKELYKMLRDEKYLEFQDQIYYALAEMAYSERNVSETIDYLILSTETSVGNDNQKAKSFLRLGEIYFQKPDYPKAQASYDSCITYMPSDFPNAEEILVVANSLKDLVNQILIIEREDSLQMVAKMTPEERMDLINDIISKRQDEEERKILEAQNRTEAAAGSGNFDAGMGMITNTGPGGGPGLGGMPGSNKWYFYNPTIRETGKNQFIKKWGVRKNEDNWRRSSKEQVFKDAENATAQTENAGFYINESGDTVKVSGDWQDPNYYLKDLPITPKQIEESNARIVEAYYQLAIIYKDQMHNIAKAIETLEDMNERFNPNVHTADSYYRLYRMNYDEEEMERAIYYKNKILHEFPLSQYAKIIKDPNYLERENDDYKAASKEYKRVFERYFKRGYYQQTIESCNEILAKYSHTQIKPKAMLLRALAIGNIRGEAALRAELEAIILSYPNNEYGLKAKEIISGLDIKNQEANEKAAAETKAKQEAEMAEKMPYKFEPNSKHNFVILVKASGREMAQIKSAINDFNRKNYKMEGLKMSVIVYKKDVQMVSVKSFGNAKQAMNYLRVFVKSTELANIVKNQSDYFIISFTNYALFFKNKDEKNYMIWAGVKYKDY